MQGFKKYFWDKEERTYGSGRPTIYALKLICQWRKLRKNKNTWHIKKVFSIFSGTHYFFYQLGNFNYFKY